MFPPFNKCGKLARSATKTELSMVLPKATGKSIVVAWNCSVANTDRIATRSAFSCGTSTPMVPLPGIGPITRTRADRYKPRSLARPFIFATRLPGPGINSYNVSVGPIVALMFSTCTSLYASVSTIFCLWASNTRPSGWSASQEPLTGQGRDTGRPAAHYPCWISFPQCGQHFAAAASFFLNSSENPEARIPAGKANMPIPRIEMQAVSVLPMVVIG